MVSSRNLSQIKVEKREKDKHFKEMEHGDSCLCHLCFVRKTFETLDPYMYLVIAGCQVMRKKYMRYLFKRHHRQFRVVEIHPTKIVQ